MFPFTLFGSEDASIIAVVVFAIIAWLSSERHAALLRRLLLATIVIGLVGWWALLVSGVFWPSERPMNTVHEMVGHLMLPVVSIATGLWLGTSFPWVVQQPFRFLFGLVLLLLLCFCCWSNTRTGYLGPSRVDPTIDPATNIRFNLFHQVAFPVFIGLMLMFWFCRLVVGRP